MSAYLEIVKYITVQHRCPVAENHALTCTDTRIGKTKPGEADTSGTSSLKYSERISLQKSLGHRRKPVAPGSGR